MASAVMDLILFLYHAILAIAVVVTFSFPIYLLIAFWQRDDQPMPWLTLILSGIVAVCMAKPAITNFLATQSPPHPKEAVPDSHAIDSSKLDMCKCVTIGGCPADMSWSPDGDTYYTYPEGCKGPCPCPQVPPEDVPNAYPPKEAPNPSFMDPLLKLFHRPGGWYFLAASLLTPLVLLSAWRDQRIMKKRRDEKKPE